MDRTMVEDYTSTREGMTLYQQERTILETTVLIRGLLKAEGMTKAELANRLGKSKAYVTQLLNGNANMTLRTISDILLALGKSLHLSAGPISLVPEAARVYSPEEQKKSATKRSGSRSQVHADGAKRSE